MGIKIYEFFKEYVFLILFGTPFNMFFYIIMLKVYI